jgi:WD40 repeat protein
VRSRSSRSLWALCLCGESLLADPKKPTYDEDVLPVFKQHRTNCHGNDKQKGGLNLATFPALQQGGSSGTVKAVLFSVETGEKVIEVGVENDAIPAADISADQTQIAVGSPSKLVRVYSTADGSGLREIKKHTDWVTAVEFSPDGVLPATGDRNGGLFVWESCTGREFVTLRGHPTPARLTGRAFLLPCPRT